MLTPLSASSRPATGRPPARIAQSCALPPRGVGFSATERSRKAEKRDHFGHSLWWEGLPRPSEGLRRVRAARDPPPPGAHRRARRPAGKRVERRDTEPTGKAR